MVKGQMGEVDRMVCSTVQCHNLGLGFEIKFYKRQNWFNWKTLTKWNDKRVIPVLLECCVWTNAIWSNNGTNIKVNSERHQECNVNCCLEHRLIYWLGPIWVRCCWWDKLEPKWCGVVLPMEIVSPQGVRFLDFNFILFLICIIFYLNFFLWKIFQFSVLFIK